MTSLILLSVLNLAPGIQLADNVSGRHVALSDARIRLVSDEEERPSIDTMTREQLAAELRRLDETRPSLVGPIVLLAVGAALFVPDFVVLNILFGSLLGSAASAATQGAGIALTYLAFIAVGVLCIVGIVLVIVGTVKLITRIVARSRNASETDAVKTRLEVLDHQPPQPGAPGTEQPPPPPQPPQASLVMPGAMQTVFTF